LGSVASYLNGKDSGRFAVGLHVSAHHVASAPYGSTVIGIARPVRLGKRTHLFNIDVYLAKPAAASGSRSAVLDGTDAADVPFSTGALISTVTLLTSLITPPALPPSLAAASKL